MEKSYELVFNNIDNNLFESYWIFVNSKVFWTMVEYTLNSLFENENDLLTRLRKKDWFLNSFKKVILKEKFTLSDIQNVRKLLNNRRFKQLFSVYLNSAKLSLNTNWRESLINLFNSSYCSEFNPSSHSFSAKSVLDPKLIQTEVKKLDEKISLSIDWLFDFLNNLVSKNCLLWLISWSIAKNLLALDSSIKNSSWASFDIVTIWWNKYVISSKNILPFEIIETDNPQILSTSSVILNQDEIDTIIENYYCVRWKFSEKYKVWYLNINCDKVKFFDKIGRLLFVQWELLHYYEDWDECWYYSITNNKKIGNGFKNVTSFIWNWVDSFVWLNFDGSLSLFTFLWNWKIFVQNFDWFISLDWEKILSNKLKVVNLDNHYEKIYLEWFKDFELDGSKWPNMSDILSSIRDILSEDDLSIDYLGWSWLLKINTNLYIIAFDDKWTYISSFKWDSKTYFELIKLVWHKWNITEMLILNDGVYYLLSIENWKLSKTKIPHDMPQFQTQTSQPIEVWTLRIPYKDWVKKVNDPFAMKFN